VPRLRWLIPFIILSCGVAGRIFDPQPLQTLSALVFDTYQQISPRPYRDAPVRIVDLDDESLSRMGQWPWPRTEVAKLVTRLTELGAAAIAFDIIFAEPDRTSPERIAPLWPSTPEFDQLRDQVGRLPDHDTVLAQAMADSGIVVSAFALTDGDLPRRPTRKAGLSYGGDDPAIFVPRFDGVVNTLPELEAAAAGSGHVNRSADQGGIVRRMPTLLSLGDKLYPSLELEALRVVQGGRPPYLVKSSGASGEQSFGAQTGVTTLRMGAFTIPTTADGSILLYDSGPIADRFVPAWRIFETDFPTDALQGVIVLVGTSAAGLKDQVATPLNPLGAGVEIHAQALEQIVMGDYLSRPDWVPGAEILALILVGGLLLAFLSRAGALTGALLLTVGVGGVIAVSWLAYAKAQLLFDPIYPAIFVILIYVVQSASNFLRVEGEKRQVRTAFGRYLSPSLVERLAENPDQLRLGGEIRDMTFLFSDIRGFTSISEHFDAQGLTSFINRFLTPMTETLLSHNATIDKYMGDAIMAFWNAPLDDAQHAANACRAAIKMQQEVIRLDGIWKAEAEAEGRIHHPIRVGVGVNSGNACVGNLGSDQRFDYSVLGDDVNLASRLEGQSKTYGVGIIVGENTCRLAPDFATLEIDLIQVKGKTKPARIFVLVGDESYSAAPEFSALRECHRTMIDNYRARDWAGAGAALDKCRDLAGDNLLGVYDLYAARLETYRASPPPEDWDSVYAPTDK
jgi:adenylate cyclase